MNARQEAATLNLLWALWGALAGVPWRLVPPYLEREMLRELTDEPQPAP